MTLPVRCPASAARRRRSRSRVASWLERSARSAAYRARSTLASVMCSNSCR